VAQSVATIAMVLARNKNGGIERKRKCWVFLQQWKLGMVDPFLKIPGVESLKRLVGNTNAIFLNKKEKGQTGT
jgi:hypothetical protein